MWILRLFALSVIAAGAAMSLAGVEICSHDCMLEELVDLLLPRSLDSISGGLPFMAIGIVLLASTSAWRK